MYESPLPKVNWLLAVQESRWNARGLPISLSCGMCPKQLEHKCAPNTHLVKLGCILIAISQMVSSLLNVQVVHSTPQKIYSHNL